MSEEELLIAELTAMQIIDFKKLGFINGKETIGKVLELIEKQQKEIENSYKVKFKVGERAKLADGISIGIMGPNHNKEVFIRKIEIREGYIDYFVDYIKDGEIHNFRCNLQERDLVKLEE